MGGELRALIEVIDFSSKDELLSKLRDMRESTVKLAPRERSAVKEIIGVGIQQAYYTTEKELLRYKQYIQNEYMNGSWYGFSIEGLDGDVEDSCWGFLYNGNMKDLIAEMKACVSDEHHALFDKMVTSKATCM